MRGKEISIDTLAATPLGCYDGPQPGSRSLALESPMQRGLDVRLMRLGLSDNDVDILADGIFGRTSVRRLKEYKIAKGLPDTGIADKELVARIKGSIS